MTNNSLLKKGWKVKTLGEVCKIIGGGTPSKKKEEFYNGDILWATVRDMKVDLIEKTEHQITIDAVKNSSTNIIPKGNVIIATRVGLGKVCLLKNDTAINQDLKGIIPKNTGNLSIDFLYRWFTSISNKIINEGTGATVQGVKLTFINSLQISLPPLKEQQQIVSILDRAFEAIDKAKANAEQNLKNAKELFESYLQEVFSNGQLKIENGEWEEKRFDEICVLQRGFDLPTRLRKEGDYPLVSSNGITDYVDVWKVKSPGVSTGRSGTIGNVHFIEKDYFPLNTSLYIKQFHNNDERCIYYFLKQFDLSRFQSGAGVPTLNRNNVHSVKVYFPKSVTEQKQIVQKLDILQIETKKLEIVYQQKIDELEELKKSVLQKAFNGQLSEL